MSTTLKFQENSTLIKIEKMWNTSEKALKIILELITKLADDNI